MSALPTPSPDPEKPRVRFRDNRLHSPQMYKKVFEAGRALRSAPLTVRYAFMAQDRTRVGFLIRKKVGNACLRNAIRRVLRDCFREAMPALPQGTWVVFDVPDRASGFRRSEMRSQAARLLAAAGSGR